MTASDTVPTAVRRLDLPESDELALQAGVFEDLQQVLRCCEHLVSTLAAPTPDTAMVEALWTSALVAYARAFSARGKVLVAGDLAELELPDEDPAAFHDVVLKLRDHYASRHTNPRETFTVGGAQNNDGELIGIAVVSASQPDLDDAAVRRLGRVTYALSALLDARMREVQNRVLGRAKDLGPAALARLPLVHLAGQ